MIYLDKIKSGQPLSDEELAALASDEEAVLYLGAWAHSGDEELAHRAVILFTLTGAVVMGVNAAHGNALYDVDYQAALERYGALSIACRQHPTLSEVFRAGALATAYESQDEALVSFYLSTLNDVNQAIFKSIMEQP